MFHIIIIKQVYCASPLMLTPTRETSLETRKFFRHSFIIRILYPCVCTPPKYYIIFIILGIYFKNKNPRKNYPNTLLLIRILQGEEFLQVYKHMENRVKKNHRPRARL